jgi:uncharacterized membrane protein YeaQ/YmgE (transglycosylase-associated protein family)
MGNAAAPIGVNRRGRDAQSPKLSSQTEIGPGAPKSAVALPSAFRTGNIARLAPRPHGFKTREVFEGVSAMGILSWIVLGLIAGFIGSKLVNKTGSGLIMDIVLGVVGAIVGGYISSALGYGTVNGLNLYSIVVAVLGAVVVLLVYRAVVARS